MSPRNNNSEYEAAFRALSAPERSILAKLLSQDFPGSADLREQLLQTRGRKIDADGSLALEPATGAIPAGVTRRIPVEAELEDVDGMTIHVLLHVINGLMNELEVYREDSSPVQRHISPDELRLIVL
jgi:hypothetical protein